MRRMLTLLLFASAITTIGCQSSGKVSVEKIRPLLEDVSGRHDRYVEADGSLSEAQRSTYLHSSAILLEIVREREEGE